MSAIIISTCKYELHKLEFVNPIKSVLDEKKIPYKEFSIFNLDFKKIKGAKKL